ncbi:hypothetical protein L207DRAFT_584824 [Hyaloscypha variabilis F]|uniref:DUF7791 domain-containing protein n=1 Tax=Hyaloscypha variabilis (strain UAMH 11265 / GT02V1 / F) TaxID=1149755 RepID=A0A2J6RHA2_HYAVF|nr:hypothetical protein L207DRAFT_584824 [Hyaloscypha variabilis F]
MNDLAIRSPNEARELVEEVIYRAEGVFLWVTLVIASLLSGLRNRDDILVLLKRLERLPPQLELLYDHMLSFVEPEYIVEASKTFQIFRAYNDFGSLYLERLYNALTADLPLIRGQSDEELKKARKGPVRLLELAPNIKANQILFYEPESLYEHMEIKLRTNCGGLLEIQRWRESDTVSYIHRTARDYIERHDVWAKLMVHVASIEPDFEPNASLLMSSVLDVKHHSLRDLPDAERLRRNLSSIWHDALRFAKRIETINPSIKIQLIHEFDRAATTLYKRANGNEENGPSELPHWSSYLDF